MVTGFPGRGFIMVAGNRSRAGQTNGRAPSFSNALTVMWLTASGRVARATSSGCSRRITIPSQWIHGISPPAYYPGSNYVDWLGLSVYGKQFNDEPWADFLGLVDWPYQEITRLDPKKPIMIAEWATGEFPNSGDKAEWIREAFAVMKTKCPRVKAQVYWHERWQNLDQSYSNLHINSSLKRSLLPKSGRGSILAGRPDSASGVPRAKPLTFTALRLRGVSFAELECQFPVPVQVCAPDPVDSASGRRRGLPNSCPSVNKSADPLIFGLPG